MLSKVNSLSEVSAVNLYSLLFKAVYVILLRVKTY